MDKFSPNPNSNPMCSSCSYILPSETSSTGLRCGIRYFNSTLFMRKLQQMHHFPEVKASNACESLMATQSTPLMATQTAPPGQG